MYKYYAACKVELQPFNQTVVLTADVFQLFIKTHPIGNTYSEYNSVMYTRYQVHIITPLQLSYASRHTRVPQLKCVIVTHPSGNTNCADHSGLDTPTASGNTCPCTCVTNLLKNIVSGTLTASSLKYYLG